MSPFYQYIYNEPIVRSSCCIQKANLKNFVIFTRKHPCCSLFWINKKSIKRRLQHRCSSVSIAKVLRTPISKNICERLILNGTKDGILWFFEVSENVNLDKTYRWLPQNVFSLMFIIMNIDLIVAKGTCFLVCKKKSQKHLQNTVN